MGNGRRRARLNDFQANTGGRKDFGQADDFAAADGFAQINSRPAAVKNLHRKFPDVKIRKGGKPVGQY